MKKFRMILLSTALLAGVGTAVASGTNIYCETFTQYRYFYGQYVPLFEDGHDYLCLESQPGICTYYRQNPWSPFIPCRFGLFIPLY
jgi:hypothetical protein